MLWDHCIVGKPPTSQLVTALQLPSQRMRALTGLCIYIERERDMGCPMCMHMLLAGVAKETVQHLILWGPPEFIKS